MSLYLLDTCAISDFFSDNGSTTQRLQATSPSQIAISAITAMEVLYGFQLNPTIKRKFSGAFRSFCDVAQIIAFDESVAQIAADIRSILKKKGTPIGPWDLLIGATALAKDCVLVTSNVREFERIDKLRIENWR